jgi:serine/threonine protein kinase
MRQFGAGGRVRARMDYFRANSPPQIMSKPKPAPLPPDTVIGGYRVMRKLAAGGFGAVYLATDKEGQQVAIKEYLPAALVTRAPGELVPQVQPEKLSLYRLGLKSFFEEGRSLAQISHPSVVSVFNFFRQNETVYMVMNYLEGASLQEFIVTARALKQQKIFRESTIRSLFDEILRGLRIVHQHKMLHLDLKPANIIITNDNRAVMLDFGAARQVLNKEANFTRPMYTPGFAAPEMYRRDSAMGPWTDIYAIGACIYSCMQGYPPNDAPQRLEKNRLSLSLTRMRGVYSDNLIEMVEWCMALDPLARPQSVFALQKELSRESERRYTKLSMSERMRLQFDNLLSDTKKNIQRVTRLGRVK